MADGPNTTEKSILNHIAQDTGDETLQTPIDETEVQPLYKMTGESKRPTSKHHGPLWKSRKDAAYNKLSQSGKVDNWDEAIRYYKNDQRTDRTGRAAKTRSTRLKDSETGDSENIVFANTSALVPAIYAKNPTCEVTSNIRDDNQPEGQDQELFQLGTVAERLVNALSSKKDTPGINLKNKARKAVVMTTLTNLSYIEVGYTFKEEGSEEALANLDATTEKLTNAKSQKEIEEAEGELQAIEQTIDFLRPSGPWVKFRHPKDVLRDPDGTESDLSDSKWLMVSDYISTAFINAVYREKSNSEAEQWKSIYQPTHVVGATSVNGVQEEINNFSILKDDLDYRSFGYADQETYNKALRTKVWYVWDKLTRRVYMYNDLDWSWPIWVWDDRYNLEGFFPLYPLEFYTDPEDDIANSEVMYYLDQQDAINEVNAEKKKIRKRIMGTLFYNKQLLPDGTVVEDYISGNEQRKAIGVDVPPDTDMGKLFFAMVPPSINYLQILEKESYFAAAARVSSVQPVMQGQQFKTNTTNEAIETYNSSQQTRLDEKIDAVEDCIGEVLWGVMQLCLQFMPQAQVAEVLGQQNASIWRNMNAQEIQRSFSVRVVGGSTQKPTSRVKKQEAIQMAQTIGQFGQAGGGAVVLLILRIMERAFDELTITTEDWAWLKGTIEQSIANSNPTGNPQQGGAEGAAPGGDVEQLAGVIDSLPPEAKKALGDAMAEGVPIQEALPKIIELIQSAQSGAPQ